MPGSWSGRRARLTALCFVMLLAACLEKARAPAASQGSLTPELVERSTTDGGKFRVVFASPRGETEEGGELSVVFDRPLRALERADLTPPALAITPPIAGVVRWVGTRALSFRPASGSLPSATEFRVELPATTRALDGSTLGSAFSFSFSTPRPKLVNAEPSDGQTGVLPTASLELFFNQAVAPATVQRLGKLRARGQTIAFESSRPHADDPRRVRLKPQTTLPLDAQISFELADTFSSEEGPLPAGTKLATSFRTYGPLSLSLECPSEHRGGPCLPGTTMSLGFNNAVRFGDVQRAISLTPAEPLAWPDYPERDSMVTYVEIPGRRAASTHRVRVAKGLRDEFKQTLLRDFVSEVRFEQPFPRVGIGISDGTLASADRAPIPIAAINVKQGSVIAAALSRADVKALLASDQPAPLHGLLLRHPGARRQSLAKPPSSTAIVQSSIDPFELLSAGGLGVLGIAADYVKDERDSDPPADARLAKVSDLGISAKVSPDGSLVWVTRLSTAEPVARAEIEIGGGKARYLTNDHGIALIPSADFRPDFDHDSKDLVFASAGTDWTFEALRDALPAWQLPVSTSIGAELGLSGLLFTERGVYRPGDSVRVKGIVRRQTTRGSALPKGEKLTLVLNSPEGEKVRTLTLPISDFGTFHADLRLPAAATLGSYQLRASLGKQSIENSVEVREYQPAQFQVDVTVEPAKVRGDKIDVEVKGKYLYGGPMRDSTVNYLVQRGASWFRPPDSDGFATDAAAYYSDLRERGIDAGTLRSEQRKLDQLGLAKFSETLALPGQRGPELLTIEAEVTDLARRTQSGASTVLVHPAEFYLGIKMSQSFVKAPGPVPVELVALTSDGKRLDGKRVKLELLERRWTWTREDRGGSHAETVSRVADKVLGSCELTSRAGGASCPLRVSNAGYHVLRARSTDGRGNAVESAAGFYVFGPGETRWQGRDDGLVELVLDKQSYQVGDKAKVLIKSPFPEARALISVERASVLHHEQRVLTGSMPSFEIEVTEDLAPNAFVSVHLLKKLGKDAASQPGGAYRVGYAEIRIDPEPRRLAVELLPNAKVFAPGDELALALKVRDRRGKAARAELTVYAVDEGVLMLTGYRTPDPLLALSEPRPLGVATLETRAQLAKITPRTLADLLGMGKGEEGGGGGDLGSRSDFRQTAYFNPSVITDAQGNAQVRFRLPDSLTSYRLMAVAVGEAERYGFGSTSVAARKRLMARPQLPRFLRAGDRFEASVVVAASEFSPGKVAVAVSAEGLSLEGPAAKSIELSRDQSREVRFGFRAERAGEARLSFDVSGGGARDRVELRRVVSVPTVLESVALSGETDSAAAEAIGSLSDVRTDVGSLELSLASTALVGLESAFAALLDYPYGCTEQLASRLLPLVPLRDLAADYGAVPPNAATRIAQAVREIAGRQLGDGGFAMWPDGGEANPWISAYALWVLTEAQARGEELPKSVFERGRGYLRGLLQREPVLLDLPTQAFVLDVLAAMRDPDPGYMNRLFEKRAGLPVFGRALLLSAFVRAGVRGEAEKTLVRELEQTLRVSSGSVRVSENLGDAYARLFDSPVRTQALVLGSLARSRPDHPLLPDLARGLLSARRGGTWRSTQETAFALIALDDYRKLHERQTPNFVAEVRLGERSLLRASYEKRSTKGQSRSLPLAGLLGKNAEALVFELEGSGRLYYQARLRYARKELPKTGFDSGFYAEKRFRRLSPEELSKGIAEFNETSEQAFDGGELVLAEIAIVTSSARQYVVIDDPLPAGFEAVDTSLLTSSSRERALDAGCLDCDGNPDSSRSSLVRRELRDDRALFFLDEMGPGVHRYRYLARATTLGRFVVPPLRVEEMYSPENFGRTGAVSIEVR
jgi:uncharacterized protein YfaS (alpha-2-macroglobulin family)